MPCVQLGLFYGLPQSHLEMVLHGHHVRWRTVTKVHAQQPENMAASYHYRHLHTLMFFCHCRSALAVIPLVTLTPSSNFTQSMHSHLPIASAIKTLLVIRCPSILSIYPGLQIIKKVFFLPTILGSFHSISSL